MPRDRESRGIQTRGLPRLVIASGMTGTGVTLVTEALQDALPEARIVDAGAQWADIAEACAPGFALLVIVTTHDPIAVTATYALVKVVRDRRPDARIEILVNRSEERDALRTYERVQVAASHFLGETVGYAGAVPEAESDGHALDPAGATMEALRALAARLEGELDQIAGRTTLRPIGRRR